MSGVKRLIFLIAAAAFALLPTAGAAASPTPTPSPALDSILAKPPSTDFTELTTGTLHGEFTSHDWATNANSAETETTLNRDGFIDGFGKTWASTPSRHALVEAVMAFNGGSGAKKALTALEASDKADAHYSHAETLTGVDPSYGVHFIDTTNKTFEDLFVFVKGNDLFFVIFASVKDDLLTLATTQAKSQFDSAPASTIPSSQWPENATSHSAAYQLGRATALVLPIIFVVGVVGVVVGLILRNRRRAAVPVYAAAVPGYGAVAPAVPEVQLSPDGNFWWDGQTWRDASQAAPPAAQRSSDGTLWWDGRNWRPVPQTAQAQPPPTA
jgi:hypothetical protein